MLQSSPTPIAYLNKQEVSAAPSVGGVDRRPLGGNNHVDRDRIELKRAAQILTRGAADIKTSKNDEFSELILVCNAKRKS
jgi:hypothetical protein